MTTLVDWQIQHHCGDRNYTPQWWNARAWFYKLAMPSPKLPMISPYKPEQINAASYDVCIGDKVKLLACKKIRYQLIKKPCVDDFGYETEVWTQALNLEHHDWQDIDLREVIDLKIAQGDFLITETDNFFNIPRHISAQFALKSSRGREGYEHLSAGFIDPAWHGSKLTMELFNANPNPIPIYKGLKIGQIIFSCCDAQPIRAYDVRGRYNNDDGVRESKG
jgi:dCTP deaminase